jgi:hypothetical protein
VVTRTPWEPEAIWEGEDAYVIGGGASLTHFDFDLLRGKNTVGCNSAFILGPAICKVVLFCDFMWWGEIGREGKHDYEHPNPEWQARGRAGTAAYGGQVIGCLGNNKLARISKDKWLQFVPRHGVRGLGTKALGWAGNTGTAAVNLALIYGAKRVFLLGFDMECGPDGRQNWHDLRYEKPSPKSLYRFRKDFKQAKTALPNVFPGREIVQVNNGKGIYVTDKKGEPVLKDGCILQDLFPRQRVEEHFPSMAKVSA